MSSRLEEAAKFISGRQSAVRGSGSHGNIGGTDVRRFSGREGSVDGQRVEIVGDRLYVRGEERGRVR